MKNFTQYFREWHRRIQGKDERYSWRRHLSLMTSFHVWKKRMMAQSMLPSDHAGPFVAYVAAFRRPQNIDTIVGALLRVPSVGRVVVSENEPGCLRGWLDDDVPRVTILRHTFRQLCPDRCKHLQAIPSKRYLIIDDDIFLLPKQIESLCRHLQENPSVPHGLYGEEWDGEILRGGICLAERKVDVINRIYAFTDSHLQEFFRITQATNAYSGQHPWRSGIWDDLIISRSGSDRPRLHDCGAFVNCPTQGKKDVAVWRTEDFKPFRNECFRILSLLKAWDGNREVRHQCSA